MGFDYAHSAVWRLFFIEDFPACLSYTVIYRYALLLVLYFFFVRGKEEIRDPPCVGLQGGLLLVRSLPTYLLNPSHTSEPGHIPLRKVEIGKPLIRGASDTITKAATMSGFHRSESETLPFMRDQFSHCAMAMVGVFFFFFFVMQRRRRCYHAAEPSRLNQGYNAESTDPCGTWDSLEFSLRV